MQNVSIKKIKIVFERDFRDYKSWKIYKLYILILIIGAVGISIGMIRVAGEIKDSYTPEGQKLWLTILGNVLLIFTMLPQIIGIPLFTTTTLTKEKARGVIISLLVTELTPLEIWMGKSWAIFFPGYLISIISIVIMVPSFYSIVPIPVSLLICVILLIPLLMFGVTLITIQISMVRSPEMAVAPSYIIGFLLLFGIPLASVLELFNIATYGFTLICLVKVLLIWAFELIFSSKMTKENLVLSRYN